MRSFVYTVTLHTYLSITSAFLIGSHWFQNKSDCMQAYEKITFTHWFITSVNSFQRRNCKMVVYGFWQYLKNYKKRIV